MKKIFAAIICFALVFSFFVTAVATYKDPIDGMEMSPGLNPVVMHTGETRFEYALYAVDMDKMTNGDFVVTFSDNVEFVSLKNTGNSDVFVYNVVGNEIYVSFMYEEYNPDDSLKMFVITFDFTGDVKYPSLKVDLVAGTFIKKIHPVVEKENKGNESLGGDLPDIPPAEVTVLGDTNLDTAITAADARLILRHASKVELLEGTALKNADANKDGFITAADARLVLRVAAGIDLTVNNK